MRTLGRVLIACTLLAAAGPEAPRAEVLGPLAPRGAVEVGYQIRWTQVEVGNPESTREIDQYEAAVHVRYAVTEFATLSGEVMAANQDFHSIDSSLRYYVVGGGLQALLWRTPHFVLSGGAHYTEAFLSDQEGTRRDETHYTFASTVQIERELRRRGQSLTAWAGLSYYFFEVEEQNADAEAEWIGNNSDRIGAAGGLNLLLFDHYQIYYHTVWVDHYQPRLGVSYRF